MPGRKSNVSTASVGPEEVTETPIAADKKASKEKDGLSVDDLSLPKSMVARLAKGVLPANTQIHKDALLALHKSATVFVSYIAANSNDNAQASGKKTVQPQDVFNALKDSEYENFLPRLEAELKKYNEMQCDKRNTYRRKVKEEKAAAEAKDGDKGNISAVARGGTENGSKNGDAGDEAAERPAKKLKGENGTAVRLDEADDADDDEVDDEDQGADEQEEDADEEVADSEADENPSDDDQPMEDALEEQEDEDDARRGMRDEALDDADSD